MNTASLRQVLAATFMGNTVQSYLVAVAMLISVIVVLDIIKRVVVSRLRALARRTATDLDDFLIGLLRHIGPPVYVVTGLYLATRSLHLAESVAKVLQVLFVLVVTFKVVQVFDEAVRFFLQKWAARAEAEDPTSAAAVKNMSQVASVILWVGGVVFVLSNLGINITSVIAGLGIGGVAVALAAQAMLGDAFSSFAIYLDKPFKVGDFIIVGDLLGTVEYVGFKTTRIRSLGGEQLVFSNSDLTSSRIRNYKRMEQRRVVFSLGVTYQTSAEQVKAIPGVIEAIVKSHQLARFDRAHFQQFGDFALVFEVVYYVLSPDYNQYMDVQQYINVHIMEEFQRLGVEFAYPTQTLYVNRSEPVSTS